MDTNWRLAGAVDVCSSKKEGISSSRGQNIGFNHQVGVCAGGKKIATDGKVQLASSLKPSVGHVVAWSWWSRKLKFGTAADLS